MYLLELIRYLDGLKGTVPGKFIMILHQRFEKCCCSKEGWSKGDPITSNDALPAELKQEIE